MDDATHAGGAITVLLVEDNPDDADILAELLRDGGARDVHLVRVETLRDGLAQLARGGFDLVLLDLSLPDSQGLETVRRALAKPAPPIIVLTGLEDEALGAAAVHAGAQHYLIKGRADGRTLLRDMHYAVERHRLLSERTEDARVFAALAHVGEELMAAVSRHALLDRLCQVTAETLGCDITATWLLDERGDVYRPAAANTAAEWERIRTLHVPRARLRPLVAAGRRAAVRWLDDRLRRELPEPLVRLPGGVGTVLYLTLQRGSGIVGTQVCGYRQRGGAWNRSRERIANGLVHLAGLALDNARLVEELEESNTIKTYFAATMSHELRNTLFAIGGFGEMLGDAAGGNAEVERLSRAITDRTQESLQLIQAALELTRSEVRPAPPDSDPLDLAALLAELAAETDAGHQRPGVDVQWDIPANLPPLRSDPLKLRMVLKNLYTNALKFTRAGSVRVAVAATDGGVRLTVSDTGIGIDPAEIPHLFEPFRQAHGGLSRRAGGAGLGLYIVARLVDLLGGRIGVESRAGEGTTISVDLPCEPPAAGTHLAAGSR